LFLFVLAQKSAKSAISAKSAFTLISKIPFVTGSTILSLSWNMDVLICFSSKSAKSAKSAISAKSAFTLISKIPFPTGLQYYLYHGTWLFLFVLVQKVQ